ncbi:MAG TPA: hypothetical protein VLC52_14640 [Anaerolineae bacterium]|nr:hypothetical protein [Anaerolineae bacterium]
MVRKRWLWVGVIALAVLLVPALLWSGRRPPAPAVEQEGAPPALAAEGNDLQPVDEGQEAPLLVVAEMDAVVTVVDGTTGAVKQALGQAVLAPDASLLYNVEQEAGQTRVQAVEPGTGRIAGEIAFEGSYNLPWVGSLPAGLSPGGRWLVLQRLLWLENGAREAGSRFAVVDLSFDAAPRFVELDGQFEFDAVSDDGTRLYLTEYVVSEYVRSEPLFERNAIRLYDLARGRLEQAVVVTKRSEEEEMSGYRRAAVASPDGTWLYSLYVDDAHSSPFVHVLNLDEGYAVCIDLPGVPAHRALDPMLWGLALSPGGETLYAANASAGMVFEIDTAGLVVRRSVDLESAGAGDTALERLARYLAPVARAKVGVVNPVLLSPNGDTLYALATNGLLALDTADLAVRGEYLTDRKLNSLAVSRDGAALYAVTLEPSRILRVAPETGEIVATLEKQAFWAGILAVGGTPALNGAEPGGSVPAACPVTRPREPTFVPPPPYDTLAGDSGSFWYGSQDLWTSVRSDGTWQALPHGSRGYTQKTFWWQPGYDPQEDPEPDLVVTGRRLDGLALTLESSRATNGFHGDLGSFMLAGIEVPEAGCWEITGRVGDQELSYVVWVAP